MPDTQRAPVAYKAVVLGAVLLVLGRPDTRSVDDGRRVAQPPGVGTEVGS